MLASSNQEPKPKNPDSQRKLYNSIRPILLVRTCPKGRLGFADHFPGCLYRLADFFLTLI
jgi:hypothetical protein